MSEERRFRVTVEREEGFAFEADFGIGGVEPFRMDEPEPVGGGSGPDASRALAAAVGDCLSSSLLFCLQKSRVRVDGMRASVEARLARNPEGRWRIAGLEVEITPEVAGDYADQLDRCVEIFEGFCIVTQSVRRGIPINVKVKR